VILDPETASIWRAWLAPTLELEGVANDYPDKLALAPSPALTSNDKYTPYRHPNMRVVADRIIAHMAPAA